ncbi:hypothetical protein K2X33_12505 [bacterium]|nr:hypothetical protein [bacterium]
MQLRNKWWIVVPFLFACTKTDYYRLDFVLNPSVNGDGENRKLSYNVNGETLFYSPGLVKVGDAYRIVRCPVKETCKVDIPTPGALARAEVMLPGTGPVVLEDGVGNRKELTATQK